MEENIYNSELRIGNFTSSEIAALMTRDKSGKAFGKPALTYIEEVNIEREMDLPVDSDSNAKPLLWGKFVEQRVFNMLGLEYEYTSDTTIKHFSIDCWAGSRDGMKFDEGRTVVEVKCPMSRKSFYRFVKCKTIEEIRENHPDGEKYYWQIVSNAILAGAKYAELIVYMPYQSELEEIREECSMFDGDQNKVAFIHFATDDQLPYIKDEGQFKNINIWRFEVPEEDKERLTESVLMAEELLIKR